MKIYTASQRAAALKSLTTYKNKRHYTTKGQALVSLSNIFAFANLDLLKSFGKLDGLLQPDADDLSCLNEHFNMFLDILATTKVEPGETLEFCISNVYLNADRAKALGMALSQNQYFDQLTLHANMLGENIKYVIEPLINTATKLATLEIKDKRIDNQLLLGILPILTGKTKLETLRIISGTGFSTTRQDDSVRLTANDMQPLAESLVASSLVCLDLCKHDIENAGAESLVCLDLCKHDIENAGAEHLAEAITKGATVRKLKLSDAKISDVGAIALCKAVALSARSSVFHLDLSKNPITTQGVAGLMQEIAHVKRPLFLNLRGIQIGDKGAEAIATLLSSPNCKLAAINLEHCGITVGMLNTIAVGLMLNTSLHCLKLGQNKFTADEVGCLINVVKRNTLRYLELSEISGSDTEPMQKLREICRTDPKNSKDPNSANLRGWQLYRQNLNEASLKANNATNEAQNQQTKKLHLNDNDKAHDVHRIIGRFLGYEDQCHLPVYKFFSM